MKIRVLSDLHLDINGSYNLKFKDKDVFTIIAGDISGHPKETTTWIKKNLTRGVFIEGNHLVYNRAGHDVQELREMLHKEFPVDSDITYLDNECGVMKKEVDGVVILGTTMYTDYSYRGTNIPEDASESETRHMNMTKSLRCMNDFRMGSVNNARMLPEDYVRWFNNAFESIRKEVEDNEKLDNPKPIIIVTHHCLSPKCISSSYVDDDNNASYITDLEWFIKEHKSIKCVISGHVHHQDIFDITRDDGSVCKYIMNPRGYCPRCEDLPGFNENTFIDTQTWEVEKQPKSKSRMAKEKKRLEEQMRALAWFW